MNSFIGSDQWGGGVVAEMFHVHKSIAFPRFRHISGQAAGHSPFIADTHGS